MNSTLRTTIVLFRNDLRIDDNPALVAASARGELLLPLFVWGPDELGKWPPGAALRWWLHHSLTSLKQDLQRLGADLMIREGESFEQLGQLIKEFHVDAVFWNRCYEPASIQRDTRLKEVLKTQRVHVESCQGNLLFEPWEIKTKTGGPFQVFTPF